MISYNHKYEKWNEIYVDELESQENFTDLSIENVKKDSFTQDLSFGTAGLRAVMGQGTNRMNIRTVTRATTGFSKYINKQITDRKPKVLIAYDSRINSFDYALISALTLEDNGIEADIFERITSVPVLSYGVVSREYDFGIMITASHNHKSYNGYKVYNHFGYQILPKEAEKIFKEIQLIDVFNIEIPNRNSKNIIENFLDETIENEYIEKIEKEIRNLDDDNLLSDISDISLNVIYSGLNGTGIYPVTKLLKKLGANLDLVESQCYADGRFPTCQNPNPELKSVYELAFNQIKNDNDLIIITDPDCDRIGISSQKQVFTGNQIGILLTDFLVSKKKNAEVLYKSIVSTPLVNAICNRNNIDVKETLIGFKYIGEAIEENPNLIMGFEEGNGYLTNSFIRDKDGISTAGILYLMNISLLKQGKTLQSRLEEVYKEYGYYKEETYALTFEGIEGKENLKVLFENFREDKIKYINLFNADFYYDYSNQKGIQKFNSQDIKEELKDDFVYGDDFENVGYETCNKYENVNKEIVNKIEDNTSVISKFLEYVDKSKEDLPLSNILEYRNANVTMILRPSGTEPKLKLYIMAKGNSETESINFINKTYKLILNTIENITTK